jgi:hypothetical protein
MVCTHQVANEQFMRGGRRRRRRNGGGGEKVVVVERKGKFKCRIPATQRQSHVTDDS